MVAQGRHHITVVGKDTVGIIAKVCTYLAENNVNIWIFLRPSCRDIST